MTPKEKAISLILSFIRYTPADGQLEFNYAKKCALICVDEILENQTFRDYGFKYSSILERLDSIKKYWEEVKTEIEKL